MRINAFLSRCGLGSRRDVEDLVRAGRVEVDGTVLQNLAVRISPEQIVKVDGTRVFPENKLRVLMMNKPRGYLCSTRDDFGRRLVYELLPPAEKGLHSIGRLDFDSRGLLFFTNEGGLSREILHPSKALPRVYQVKTNRPLSPQDFELMKKGILLPEGQFAKPSEVLPGKHAVEIVLTEGKKREVRHLVEATGKRVVDLYRTSFAGIRIGHLPEGECRHLSSHEMDQLLQAAGWKGSSPSVPPVQPSRGQ